MNQLHYPSFELCKKLTEAGFPETEKMYLGFRIQDYIENIVEPFLSTLNKYICPSVMELLDEFHCLRIEKDGGFQVSDIFDEEYADGVFIENRLPDALAERWLWLKENDLLPKK